MEVEHAGASTFGADLTNQAGQQVRVVRDRLIPGRHPVCPSISNARALLAARALHASARMRPSGDVDDSRPSRGDDSTFAVVLRTAAKHGSDVFDYLALLAWNRVVMSLVGGPARTTIDTLMTRQFHGFRLVWVWTYTAVVSSVSVAVVRWAVAARVRLESEPTDPTRLASAVAGRGARGGAAAAFTHTVRHRFRVSVLRRVATSFTYVTMWAWAVALLGSLPSETFAQEFSGVLALSLLFALVVWAGRRGRGPLRGLLRVVTEHTQPIPTEDVAAVLAGNEIAAAAHDGVRACCEWILAVAWVGATRRAFFVAYGNPGDGATDARAQLAGWSAAIVAILLRGGFIAWTARRIRFGDVDDGDDESAYKNLRGDGTRASLLESGDGDARSGSRLSSRSSLSSGSLLRDAERAVLRASSRLRPATTVARDATDMLASAFAFTTGVALNAAAQTTWASATRAWGGGAAAPAAVYALALSAVTVAAAAFGKTRRSETDDETEEEEEDAFGFGFGLGFGDDAREDTNRRACASFRTPGGRRLIAEWARDEERVGAFVAGFVWNTAFVLATGTTATRWPWTVALGVTLVAAGYSVAGEWIGAIQHDD